MGISNNIMLFNSNAGSGWVAFYNVASSYISNNIVFRSNPTYFYTTCNSNTFERNILATMPEVGTNTFTDNYNNIDISTVFVNQTGVVFDYSHDYHLVNPSLYLGTDGTQVGIYGGFYPYKGESVPVNPHIQLKNISTHTDSNGEINIQMQVEAQDY